VKPDADSRMERTLIHVENSASGSRGDNGDRTPNHVENFPRNEMSRAVIFGLSDYACGSYDVALMRAIGDFHGVRGGHSALACAAAGPARPGIPATVQRSGRIQRPGELGELVVGPEAHSVDMIQSAHSFTPLPRPLTSDSVQGVPAMKKTYKVELELTLDAALESQAIQVARDYYSKSGGAEEPISKKGNRMRKISAEDFVSDARDAIMELADGNEWFKKVGIEVVGVSCGKPEAGDPEQETRGSAAPQQGAKSADEEEGHTDAADLDDFETGMYLCRWPNGEFSLVMALTRREALIELDEWAPGHPGQLFPMESCMLDFRLNDDGQIEFNQFGEDTEAFIWETAYPVLDEIRYSEALTGPDRQYTPEGGDLIRKAVEQERTRLWETQPKGPEAETEAGKQLQKQLGMAGPVADYYVQQTAKRILESKPRKKGKPN
jgi:hypothetical protein